ncbi:hypothetical protein MFM001_42510 [Mycobacterium sp. MFM001]|nr:hypothetical protein MFM001_42510 [Mycobacterium sp. MFM001]
MDTLIADGKDALHYHQLLDKVLRDGCRAEAELREFFDIVEQGAVSTRVMATRPSRVRPLNG